MIGMVSLLWENGSFDLVISINTLHNLHAYDLEKRYLDRKSRQNNKYICVESYRNEEEKANLLYWQVTCEALTRHANGSGGLIRYTATSHLFILTKS